MKMTHWTDDLVRLRACNEAVTWARGYPDLTSAWAACEHGDWMLWLAGRMSGRRGSAARKRVVRAACACARLVLPIWEARYPDDQRPRATIEAAEAYCDGTATMRDVRAAAAAVSATYSAAADAVSAAAAAADYAAYAANAAADAAYAAAAADVSATADARSKVLAQCADIMRQHYPEPPDITQR